MAYMASKESNESVDINRSDGKFCFVTIGATAGFDSLIRAVLDKTFIHVLESYRYTDLVIQYGKDEGGVYKNFQDKSWETSQATSSVRVTGFGFKNVGLGQEMGAAKGGKNGQEGVVISHAGKSWAYQSFQRFLVTDGTEYGDQVLGLSLLPFVLTPPSSLSQTQTYWTIIKSSLQRSWRGKAMLFMGSFSQLLSWPTVIPSV